MKNDLTLMQFFDQIYCLKPGFAGASLRTVASYRCDVQLLNTVFLSRELRQPGALHDMRPSDFDADLIERAMALRRSQATRNRLLRVALSLWNWARVKGYSGPVENVLLLRESSKQVAWSVEEFERILSAAGELPGTVGPFRMADWFTALLLTLDDSIERPTAVMAIQWDWVDLDEGRLVISAEARKEREAKVVELKPRTVEMMGRLLGNGKPGVFDDWPLDRAFAAWPALTMILKRLLVDAGLRSDVRAISRRDLWHKLRLTAAAARWP